MANGGKVSATKLSFTLPISCQICLEKVKEPVTCPNQHVFCSLCMEVWLERNKQCPTCRVDITPQSPVRKIIGGTEDHNKEIRSPRTSKQLRRARMELLIRDYENEIAELQRENACLQHSNDELKVHLAEPSSSQKSKCNRCGNMKDIDSMLEMAKSLQEATKTFEKMKGENVQLRKTNEKLLKDLEDIRRSNASVKQELLMRSPMKFGRLTVATLESRIEAYEKEVSQLKKALEKSDLYTDTLKQKLSNCSCEVGDSKLEGTVIHAKVELPEDGKEALNESFVCLSGHDYIQSMYSQSSVACSESSIQPSGRDASDAVTAYGIESILTDDTANHSLALNFDENTADQSLFLAHEVNLSKSPFTPSAKLSKLSLTTPKQEPFENICDDSVQTEDVYSCLSAESFSEQTSTTNDTKVFTPQTMPPIESPGFKEKLLQIQGSLLHPIVSSTGSSCQTKSFSRRLTFDDVFQSEPSGIKLFDENTRSSFSEDAPPSMTNDNDDVQSFEMERHGSYHSYDGSRFVPPQSFYQSDDSSSVRELVHGSSNPILSTGHFEEEEKKAQVALSVVEAGGSRITTTKLSDSDRDVFTRPSSAPSRTFLLSGSRFSALRPLDPEENTQPSQFQPVKCKSPSPFPIRQLHSDLQSRSIVTPKKEAIRCIVDGRASSPMLQLVSPDDVMSGGWIQTSYHSRSQSGDSFTSNQDQKRKEPLQRVAILKRNTSGKPLHYIQNSELTKASSYGIMSESEETATSSRRNSRKQCLSNPNSKRTGDHSLEFLSPIKSPKVNVE